MKQFKQYIKSFKELDLEFIHTVMYDILLYSCWALSFVVYGLWTTKIFEKLNELDIASLQTAMQDITKSNISNQQAELSLQILQSTITKFIFLTLLLILIILGVYALFKGLIWTKILKKKFTFKYFRKFIALNLLYVLFAVVVFILPVLLVLLGIEAGFWLLFLQILFVFVAIVYFYFRTISNILFTKTKKISSFFNAFGKGADKFKKLVMPLVFMLLTFLAILLLSTVLNLVSETISLIIAGLLLLVFIAWVRIYLVKLI